MASGQIKKTDIAEADLYSNIRESAKQTLNVINQLNTALKQEAQTIKGDLKTGLDNTTASINKNVQASKQAENIAKTSMKLDQEKAKLLQQQRKAEQELEKINQQKEKTSQQRLKTQQQQNKETERQNRLAEKNKKIARDQANAYKQLVNATRDQKNESKRLGAELLKLEQSGRKNTREYRNLEQQYRKVTTAARNGDRQLKKLDKTVGDNQRNVGNYRGALGKLSSALSSVGLAFGSAMIVRDVFKTMADFDQAQANLASILAVSRNEMKELTETALELGATTKFTAAQVSQLQLEFAKLGFSQEEIQNVTKATLELAAASGTDLAEAATVVGANVRAFGLSTYETQRVVDVMAKSFTSSSLDMSKFSTAMRAVAPVAKNAGVNIERTTAMIGTLTDRGIDASTAGTGLRNVFLELSKKGLTFEEAMNKILTATDKNKASLELFGKRGAVIGTILAESAESIETLEEKLNNAGGAAAKMAAMQLDTVKGSLDLLNSAWQGYILNADKAGGVSESIKGFLQGLAENLEFILNTLVTLTKAWLYYKVITLGQLGVNKLLNASFLTGAKNMGVMRGAAMGLGNAFLRLGRFIQNNIAGIALLVVVELIATFKKLSDIANRTEDAMEGIAEAQSKLKHETEQETREVNRLFDALRKTNPQSEERLKLMNKLNGKYGLTLKNLKDEKKFTDQLAEAQENLLKKIRARVELQMKQIGFEKISEEFSKLEFDLEKAERTLDDFYAKSRPEQLLKSALEFFGAEGIIELKSIRDALKEELAELTPIFEKYRDDYEKALADMEEAGESVPTVSEIVFGEDDEDGEKTTKKTKTTIEKLKNNLLSLKDIDKLIKGKETGKDETWFDTLDDEVEEGLTKVQNTLKRKFLENREIYKDDKKKLEEIERQFRIDMLQAELDALEKKKLLNQIGGADVLQIEKAILDKRIELSKAQAETTEETENEIVEIVRISADEQIKIIGNLTDAFNRLADERIAKLDEEMNKAQERYDLYLQLAKDGNINAQQSLATEQRLIAESNRKKEQLERKKQRVQLASDTLQAYLKNSEDPNVKNPLLKTFSDITLLTQFIQNLPAFAKGTEDTGTHGEGVDGKGGFHAILHPNERVLTKKQNEMIGDMSNDELSNLALKYQAGELQSKINVHQSKQPEPNEVVQRLKSLEQTIKMKPETNIELERIIDGALTITKSVKKGNTVVYNRYRTKK